MQDGASNISNYTNKNCQNTSATCWWADLFFDKNPTWINIELSNLNQEAFLSQVLSSRYFPISNHCQSVKHWTEIYWWWKYDKYQQISLQFSAATHNFRAVSEHWPWYVQVEFQSQLHSCQGLYNLSHLWKKAFRVEPWFFTAKYHSFVFLL